MALSWYRVHTIVLNDPGRLIAVHIMHTSLVAGWAGSMCFYEISIYDPSEKIVNPMWRQWMFVIPFMSRLGVVDSWSQWSVENVSKNSGSIIWSFEGVGAAHILLSGALFMASIWHWVYWDLDIFRDWRTDSPALDLPKVFSIHLLLSSILWLGFGLFHIYSIGIWVSDPYGLYGTIQTIWWFKI